MTTEQEALADILAWSLTCPAWQRDALRRLGQAADAALAGISVFDGRSRS